MLQHVPYIIIKSINLFKYIKFDIMFFFSIFSLHLLIEYSS